MKSASKYESENGSFIIVISGNYVVVNNASRPTDRDSHYSQLAAIKQFIRAMELLGISAPLIYDATIMMLGRVKDFRFVESW